MSGSVLVQCFLKVEDRNSLLEVGGTFGAYHVMRLLGRGGMGEVYLVRHQMLDECFALKILDPDIANGNPEYVRRFLREAKIASKIRHPNLVQVHDAGYDNGKGVYFIVMDYVGGSNLRMTIGIGGAMGHREAVRIVASVASALAAGERLGVVHRDIKPENIMIEEDGTVKLVDLGVAKAKGTDSLMTMQRSVFGTPNYISPEQALDASTVDGRADVYSLGIVLYELLCGRRPYSSDKANEVLRELLSPNPIPDVRVLNPAVPQKLSALLSLMCAKSPEDRIKSASSLLEMLGKMGYGVQACNANVSVLRPPSPTGECEVDYSKLLSTPANNTLSFDTEDKDIREFVSNLKSRRRRRRIVAVASAILVLLVVVTVVAFCYMR